MRPPRWRRWRRRSRAAPAGPASPGDRRALAAGDPLAADPRLARSRPLPRSRRLGRRPGRRRHARPLVGVRAGAPAAARRPLPGRLPPWAGPAARGLVRGDGLGRRLRAIGDAAARAPSPMWQLWLGAALAAATGLAWALLTYGAGAALARLAGQPALDGDPSAVNG